MKVLLISDIHSNIEALEEVLNHASFDEVLFTGDIVDYGPDPTEVFNLLLYIKASRVLGNHDAAAAFRIDCRSSPVMHRASVVTRERITRKLLSDKSLQLLGRAERRLDVAYGGMKVSAMHGAPGNELYRYLTKDEAEKLNMDGADLMVLGHTHVAYEVKRDALWVVNPGSVGMPADGDSRASYAVLDTNSRKVTFGRVKYDIDSVISKLRDHLREEKAIFELLANAFRTAQRQPSVA